MMRRLEKIIGFVKDFTKYCIKLALDRFAKQEIMNPMVINFPVTNKCTYSCVMCNVWKPEYSGKPDLTVEQIKSIFSKQLFKNVKHVGISGGEPLIRKDLAEVVNVIAEQLPELRTVSIITNASLDCTLRQLTTIKEVLDNKGISLNVEVSIDGIGKVHDLNRGISGAFDKTFHNFKQLVEARLVNKISTTITKENCQDLYSVYQFARYYDVPIAFRLASRIGRLYNDNLSCHFTFSNEEKLRLIKFFRNIINNYGKNFFGKAAFYESLIRQLQGGQRETGCEWNSTQGLSLDPYGNLYFCFPYSPKLVNLLSVDENYDLTDLMKFKPILSGIKDHCSECTHDYNGLPSLKLVTALIKQNIIMSRINLLRNDLLLLFDTYSQIKPRRNSLETSRVVILGWYGTETLGDKAILGGIINNLRRDGYQNANITIMSLDKLYTELTIAQMELEDISVVDTYTMAITEQFYEENEMFIFGGGPLCDVEQLVDMLRIFRKAHSYGKETMIYAAGIGPLKQKRYIKTLDKLLAISDRVSFRDKLCLTKYKKVLPNLKEEMLNNVFIDPATNYIRKVIRTNKQERLIGSPYILFALRDWPYMYAGNLTPNEFVFKKSCLEKKFREYLEVFLAKDYDICLLPMNDYYRGDDDRDYYARLFGHLWENKRIHFITHDYSPMDAINYFANAELALCMRFHSTVFSITTNTKCIAIDYQYDQGKVSGFMKEVGLDHLIYSIESILNTDPLQTVQKLINSNIQWARINEIIDDRNELLYQHMSLKQK